MLHVTNTAAKYNPPTHFVQTHWTPPPPSHVQAALRIVVEEILGGATEIKTAKSGGTSQPKASRLSLRDLVAAKARNTGLFAPNHHSNPPRSHSPGWNPHSKTTQLTQLCPSLGKVPVDPVQDIESTSEHFAKTSNSLPHS